MILIQSTQSEDLFPLLHNYRIIKKEDEILQTLSLLNIYGPQCVKLKSQQVAYSLNSVTDIYLRF